MEARYCQIWSHICNCLRHLVYDYELFSVLSVHASLVYTVSSIYFFTASKWVVHILDEGVGHNIGLTGLCIVTISNSKSTFSISSFYTGKLFLIWHRDDLKTRLSGCIESLIFLEADETCYGGPGLLWMQHPTPKSMILQKQLNE